MGDFSCIECGGETVTCQVCPKCHLEESKELARLKGRDEVTQQILIQTSVLTAQSLFAIAAAQHGEHWGDIALGDLANESKKLDGLLAIKDALSKEVK